MANNQRETAETFRQQARIVQQLSDQFAHLLEPDIIESVVVGCNYDAEASKRMLGELLGHNVQEESPKNTLLESKDQKMDHQEGATSTIKVTSANKVTSAVEYAREGFRVIVILRGLPGSGKSTLGRQMLNEIIGSCYPSDYIYSADDYFLRNGEYRYNQYELREAHLWTQKLARQALQRGKSPIFIDNTNTQMWEMQPYCEWAIENGYQIFIEEPRTSWAFRVGELARRNKHNVPRAKIQDMLDRYEHRITPEGIMKAYNLSYKRHKPPMMRNFPPLPQLVQKVSQDKLGPCTKDAITNTGGLDEKGRVVLGKNTFVNYGQLPPTYPRAGCFDKGTMTIGSDEYDQMEGLSAEEVKIKAIEYLQELFVDIPRDYLEDVLFACGGDMEWCLNILSDDNKMLIDGYEPPKKVPNIEEPKEIPVSNIEEVPKIEDKPSEEQRTNLKKYLESNIVINPEHYGPNASKLKGFTEIKSVDPPVPGTSQGTSPDHEGFVLVDPEQSPCEDSSDVEDTISEDSEGRDQDGDTIEVNLGPELVRQLKLLFGDPGLSDLYSPIVEIPRELGKQLHALYYESLLKQMEAQQVQLQHMIAEDEEMQMKLQLEEIRKMELGEEEEVPNLKQIMKDQAEAQRQQKYADSQWHKLTPDEMAYKMTIQKLEASFPKLSAETLAEMYEALERNFEETVSTLRDSGADYQENARKTLSAGTLKEMQVAHDHSKQARLEDQEHFEGAVGGIQRSSMELRAAAQEHQKRRDQMLNRAREYYHKGMTEVATFYSGLASDQTRMWEKYNSLAAVQIVSEGFNRNNDSDTIDLHFLHVPEALNLLDIYIDEHINKLQTKGKSKQIFVITGRGKNSPNGRPKIRPGVEQRLKKRNLRFNRVNPGLLKVTIFKNSAVTAGLE